MSLETINSHPRDKYVQFFEEYEDRHHIYRIEGCDHDVISVTTRIGKFWNKFDSAGQSKRIADSARVKDPNDIYYGMTQEQIKNKWDSNDAAVLGTAMHEKIELYYNNQLLPEQVPNTKEFKQFLEYDNNLKFILPEYRPYRTEWNVYDDDRKIAGSIDMTYENINTGEIIIADWKRVDIKKFYDSYRKKGFGPFSHLDDNKFNKYAIQLNTYRHLLENFYNKRISAMYLCLFHPDTDSYNMVNVPRMENEIKEFFRTFY